MNIVTSYYPVLMVKDVAKCSEFFTKNFEFEVVYDSDWYVHLSKKGQRNVNLAFVHFDHDSVPAKFRKPSSGILLNLEVEDIDIEYQKLKGNVPVELELREEAWGQKHFILSAPENILVDVIKVIPPSEDFKDSYLE
jgi:catechol 2,3-dioxygenase-like lactoylglutathione lyase family enzyme